MEVHKIQTLPKIESSVLREKREQTVADLKSLPKIDLHRHLEGSLRLETLLDIARKYNLNVPTRDLEALRPFVQVTNDPPTHEAFLRKFEVLRHFYRSPEMIQRLVYEAIADAAVDNVKYLELRFSPQALSRVRGFAMSDTTDWVIESVRKAEADLDIQVGLIVTLGSRRMFGGASPSGKNRQPAASSSLLILMRAVASLSGIQSPAPAMVVWRHQWPPWGAIFVCPFWPTTAERHITPTATVAWRSVTRHALKVRKGRLCKGPDYGK